jgi:hypothetical protein
MVVLATLRFLCSFFYREYITHIQVLSFLLLPSLFCVWPPLSVARASEYCSVCIRPVFYIWERTCSFWPFLKVMVKKADQHWEAISEYFKIILSQQIPKESFSTLHPQVCLNFVFLLSPVRAKRPLSLESHSPSCDREHTAQYSAR